MAVTLCWPPNGVTGYGSRGALALLIAMPARSASLAVTVGHAIAAVRCCACNRIFAVAGIHVTWRPAVFPWPATWPGLLLLLLHRWRRALRWWLLFGGSCCCSGLFCSSCRCQVLDYLGHVSHGLPVPHSHQLITHPVTAGTQQH